MNNFRDSLAMSHAAEDLPFWRECYEKAFPSMQKMVNHRQDGDHQRLGIDRSIILSNSKQILIDEKVRGRNKKTNRVYDDILLEYMSDSQRGIKGWVCKPLLCDYIAYAIAPIGECYLLPVVQLQGAWELNKHKWMEGYTIKAENEYQGRRWTTLSKAVSVNVLFKAIGNCLRIKFSPFEMRDQQ